MKELYIEDLAGYGGPESCVGDPVRAQRSVDRGRAGGAIEPRNDNLVQGADAFSCAGRQHSRWRYASRWGALRGWRSQARATGSMHENRL